MSEQHTLANFLRHDKEDKKYTTYFGKKVIMAIGRKGADWLADICEKHNIKTEVGSVDIGVRYELPDEVMKEVNKYFYEAKFIGRPSPFCDKVRAFCQNPSGFVATEVFPAISVYIAVTIISSAGIGPV